MRNYLLIALVCGVVAALPGCGKKGPLDTPDAPESTKTKFDVKSYSNNKNNSYMGAKAPKECKSTIFDPLIGAECPPENKQ